MSTDFTEQWSNMQKMFLQSSEISATFRENARQFWENQGKVLDNMQALRMSGSTGAVPELTQRARP